jgi:hypothetical protein
VAAHHPPPRSPLASACVPRAGDLKDAAEPLSPPSASTLRTRPAPHGQSQTIFLAEAARGEEEPAAGCSAEGRAGASFCFCISADTSFTKFCAGPRRAEEMRTRSFRKTCTAEATSATTTAPRMKNDISGCCLILCVHHEPDARRNLADSGKRGRHHFVWLLLNAPSSSLRAPSSSERSRGHDGAEEALGPGAVKRDGRQGREPPPGGGCHGRPPRGACVPS